jgi:hypothetical protein
MEKQKMSDERPMGQVIQIDEARIRDHLGEMVRGTVEETLNAQLDAEADRLNLSMTRTGAADHLRRRDRPFLSAWKSPRRV